MYIGYSDSMLRLNIADRYGSIKGRVRPYFMNVIICIALIFYSDGYYIIYV